MRSLLDLLDQVGTTDDALVSTAKLGRRGPYSAKYLALRVSHVEMPGLKASGDWRWSLAAVRAYRETLGRGGRL